MNLRNIFKSPTFKFSSLFNFSTRVFTSSIYAIDHVFAKDLSAIKRSDLSAINQTISNKILSVHLF